MTLPDDRVHGRRTVLRAFVNTALGLLGASLASVVGRFALVPRASARQQWFRGASLADLEPHTPFPAVLAVPREDGWSRGRANETVFLVWDGLTGVKAMSATCTHLGCRVRWDNGAQRFKCPCHGGQYDTNGTVTAGPPPRPLQSLAARITDEGEIEVRL